MSTLTHFTSTIAAGDSESASCFMRSLPSGMNGVLENFQRLIFSELLKVARTFVRVRGKNMTKKEIVNSFFRDCEGTEDCEFWGHVAFLSDKITNDPYDVSPYDFLFFGAVIMESYLEFADNSRRVIMKEYFKIINLLLNRYPRDISLNNMKNFMFEALNPLLNTDEGNN